jgi:hypothetical protein
MKLTTNIGTADRLIRLAAGALLIALAATGAVGPWGWIGVLPLATAFLRVCPAYSLLGIKTCSEC